MTKNIPKASLKGLRLSDFLKAFHLGIPVGSYLARFDKLNQQVEEVKNGGSGK